LLVVVIPFEFICQIRILLEGKEFGDIISLQP
jgi:hypothetical protein